MKKIPIIDVNTGKVIKGIEDKIRKRLKTKRGQIAVKINKVLYNRTNVKDALEVLEELNGREVLENFDELVSKGIKPSELGEWIKYLASLDGDFSVLNKKISNTNLYITILDDGEVAEVRLYTPTKILFSGYYCISRGYTSVKTTVNLVNGQIMINYDSASGMFIFDYKGKTHRITW